MFSKSLGILFFMDQVVTLFMNVICNTLRFLRIHELLILLLVGRSNADVLY